MTFGVKAQDSNSILAGERPDTINFKTYGIHPEYRFQDPNTGNTLTAFTLEDEREIVYRLKALSVCYFNSRLYTKAMIASEEESKELRATLQEKETQLENKNGVIANKDTVILHTQKIAQNNREDAERLKKGRNKWVGVSIGEFALIVLGLVIAT